MPKTSPLPVKVSPDALVRVGAALTNQPAVRAIVDDVINKLRYSFAAAAAEDAPSAPGRADRVFAEFLASRTPADRAGYKARAGQMLGSPSTRTAHFGRFGAVEPHDYRAMGADKVTSKVGALEVDRAVVQKEVMAITKRTLEDLMPSDPKIALQLPKVTGPHGKPLLNGLPKPNIPDIKAGLAYKKLKLFVTRVKCIEETSEIGSDEIAMGGSAVDTKGNTHIVGDFMVHDDFDQGDQVNLGFGRTFFTWDLATAPAGFPYVYGALLVMAEKDDGGFYKMLKEIWDIVSGEVKILLAAGLGAWIGSIVSGPFAGLGAVVGAAIGGFIGWLVNALDNPDDLVEAKALTMTLTSSTKSYYDWAKLTSPQGWTTTLRFKGDGGVYEVDVAYRVFV
jgi:hypothetical protein